MAKSRSKKQENKSSKSQEESTLPPGPDPLEKMLEDLYGRSVTEDEYEEMDRLLSGLPMEEEMEDEETPQDEADETQPPPSGVVLDLMEEFGVDRQTAEKWADMI